MGISEDEKLDWELSPEKPKAISSGDEKLDREPSPKKPRAIAGDKKPS
jgi:hypothetical protein